MCFPGANYVVPAVISAVGIGASVSANKSAARQQQQAFTRQLQQGNQQLANQGTAAQDYQNQLLQANQTQGQLDRERGASIQEAIAKFSGPAQTELASERVAKRQAKQKQAISQSQAAGLQTPGSDVKGRVSEAFSEAKQAGEERTVNRAQRRGGQLATIGGVGGLPRALSSRGADLSASLNQINQRASGQAGIDQLRLGQAGIVDPVPHEIFDIQGPSTFNQLLQALPYFAPYASGFNFQGAPRGPQVVTTPGGSKVPIGRV